MRFIILPQALTHVCGIVNTFIGLFKDTTLVSIIGIFEVMGIFELHLKMQIGVLMFNMQQVTL